MRPNKTVTPEEADAIKDRRDLIDAAFELKITYQGSRLTAAIAVLLQRIETLKKGN